MHRESVLVFLLDTEQPRGLSLVIVCGLAVDHTFLVLFFFSSRRRHTRSDRDWSSDVCSSDLNAFPQMVQKQRLGIALHGVAERGVPRAAALIRVRPDDRMIAGHRAAGVAALDRKSVV